MSVPQVARKIVTAIPGPKSEALKAEHTRYVSAGVGQGMPVFAETASGSTITDVDGNRFIDLASGIAVTGVGNCAPEVVAAVREEVAKLTHTNFATTPYANYIEVCKKLDEHTPGDFAKKSVLVNSGAEAVENAIKIARKYTGRSAIVVMENAFHGRTNLTMAMTTKSMPYKQGFGALLNVGSCAGLMPAGPYMATYYATKAYVVSLTSALAQELREARSPVYVGCLCPGPVNTEFNAVANVEFALRGITPEYCVRCALDGMARRKTVIVPNPVVAAGMTLGRFLPRPVYIKIAAHQQRKKLYKR